MLFNSVEFAIFLPIVFFLYWFVTNNNLKTQNILLLLASYVFYGWWDWRFLFLLTGLSASNYLFGIAIDKNDLKRSKRLWFHAGLLLNLGILCIFKYFNFFIDSFIDLISLTGYIIPRSSVRIILPLGISFYIFLSVSYLIDIYKKNLVARRNIAEVLLSLGFFPIILAGPIQRPSSLLPQIEKKREFSYEKAVNGLKQVLWGLFVKVAIADNIAVYADVIFDNYSGYTGSTLLMGAVFYSIQIYADFSGYSHIAIGIASLFGFELMQNFAYPYFSRDITEFWKRWHISLTNWFRDYIFLPLSFKISSGVSSDKVLFIKSDLFIYTCASLVTWFLTGLWHGASYTFIVWGMIHGLFLILYRMQIKSRKKVFKKFGISNRNPGIVLAETFITLAIVIIAWIFFRAQTLGHAKEFIAGIFSQSLFSIPEMLPKKMILMIFLFFIAEWIQRDKQHALQLNNKETPKIIRWGLYYAMIIMIIIMGGSKQEFIYFQF
jgi:D-alanyl-lipoteichoic acid acyltransferase DltB (MBOAT superfamily)